MLYRSALGKRLLTMVHTAYSSERWPAETALRRRSFGGGFESWAKRKWQFKLLKSVAFVIGVSGPAYANRGLSLDCTGSDPNDRMTREMQWTVDLDRKTVSGYRTTITASTIRWWVGSEVLSLDRRTKVIMRRSTRQTDQVAEGSCIVNLIEAPANMPMRDQFGRPIRQ